MVHGHTYTYSRGNFFACSVARRAGQAKANPISVSIYSDYVHPTISYYKPYTPSPVTFVDLPRPPATWFLILVAIFF